ncbi:MAG: DUF4391 domain-containing protein [Petrimonas sp.]|nr:DUF4391 domain-containing protein [Petrimonas sp.]
MQAYPSSSYHSNEYIISSNWKSGCFIEQYRRLKEDVERARRRQQLEKQIAALEKRIANEKQFNRQVEMNGELKKLQKEFDGLL